MKGSRDDDGGMGSPSGSRDERKQIALSPYQRDVLRLKIRYFQRPEAIPDDTWHDILFGQAVQISASHLTLLADMAQDLPSALEYWEPEGS